MKKIIYTIALLLIISAVSFAEKDCSVNATGSLSGTITDLETAEVLMFASVVVYKDDIQITGSNSDLEGRYKFDGLHPGHYELHFFYLGYEHAVRAVSLDDSEELELPVALAEESKVLSCVEIIAYAPKKTGCVYWACTSTISAESKLEEKPNESITEKSKKEINPEPEINFFLYPNPAQDRLTIDLQSEADRIIVYDAMGKEVYSEEIFERGPHRIDVHNYMVGSYYIALFYEGKLVETKPLKVIR